MKVFYIFLLNVMTIWAMNAQQITGYCGMTMQDQEIMTERLMANIEASRNSIDTRSGETKYIPVRFHLVSNSSGNGAVNKKNVLRMLCKLNENYKDIGLQFYIKDQFNEFNNDNAFNNPMSGAAKTAMNGRKDKNALNLYITASAGEQGVLGFYDPQFDWVVLPKSEINANAHTGSHEIGHFFSLRHTFYGWEGCPWTEACLSLIHI